MVNVASKSTSCRTCRTRKKGGCDMKRPSCGQCLKLGVSCGGYGHPIRFVNVTPDQVKQRWKFEPVCQEQDYSGLFWRSFLPDGRELPAGLMGYTNVGWLNGLHSMDGQPSIVREIVLALSLMTASHLNEKVQKARGARHYTQVLKDLSISLSGTDQLTALCIVSRLCGQYEMLFGQDMFSDLTQARNWRQHVFGELALVTSRPPEAYASGFLHQFFVDGRLVLAAVAIQKRQSSVLSESEWKTKPWAHRKKTVKDWLLDVFVDLPGILQSTDTMNECEDHEEREMQRKALVTRIKMLERRLRDWRRQVGIKASYSVCSDRPFSLELLAVSHIMCLYWSVCIILYSTQRGVLGSPGPDVRFYCRKIAEALPLLLRPESGMYGTHLCNFPTSIALMYLNATDGDSVSVEKTMILDALNSTRHGPKVVRFCVAVARQASRSEQIAGTDGSGAEKAWAQSWLGQGL